MAHARQNVGLVGFDLHPPAATEALLPAPQFTVQERLVNFQSGGQSGKKGDQRLAMRLPRSEVTKHCFGIVSDEKKLTEKRELISDN